MTKGEIYMAKTKEELDALKEKLKAIKAELKELSEEELKAIAGGDGETDCQDPTCPKCGSADVSVNVYSKMLHCNKCGYDWR